MQSWVWRQLRVELPDDWELLQFSRNPQTGRCAFADRYQFRFEMDWRVVPGAPDMERTLTDYGSRLVEDGLQDVRRLECRGWQGVTGVMADRRTTCRYGAYLDALKCMVELVFLWPKARHEPSESQILASFRPELPTALGQLRWQAFGMDLLTTAGGFLEHCTADPGFAQLKFSVQRRRWWEQFSRRGLLAHWLREPVPQWLRRSLPRGFRPVSERLQDRHGHSVAQVCGERAFIRLADLLLGRREHVAASWVCPHDGRLYQFSHEGPRAGSQRPPARPPLALRCCPDLEVTL